MRCAEAEHAEGESKAEGRGGEAYLEHGKRKEAVQKARRVIREGNESKAR